MRRGGGSTRDPGQDLGNLNGTSGSVDGAFFGYFSYFPQILSTFGTFRQNLKNLQTQNELPGRGGGYTFGFGWATFMKYC